MSHDPSEIIADLLLQKHFLLLVVLFNIFVETVIHFFQDYLIYLFYE